MGKFTKEEYKSRVEAIYTRFPSVQKVDFGKAYKPGLETMIKFAARLGNPHNTFRSIHVAGTNGKGSVANMLASALQAAGLKVGLYTSPHILDFRERMRVDGEMVPEEYVYDFLTANEEVMETLGLSFFELTTGMAFRWFADCKVDVAVVEVGLGGRLDSTNIIGPDLSIITSIALDHCSMLGNTLEEIAAEKAGIFKKSVPALVGEALPQTRLVFQAKARRFCHLTFAEDKEPSLWERKDRILMNMDLRGAYQKKNLRTVLAAIDLLKPKLEYSGLRNTERIVEAIENTAGRMHFPARWEKLRDAPLVIADMGHNPAALKENFAQLEKMKEGEGYSLVILYAIMADKDLEGILPLMPEDAEYVFTSPSSQRSLPVGKLFSRYLQFCDETGRNKARAHFAENVEDALDKAFGLAGGKKTLVFVGGSAYLVSDAEQILRGK